MLGQTYVVDALAWEGRQEHVDGPPRDNLLADGGLHATAVERVVEQEFAGQNRQDLLRGGGHGGRLFVVDGKTPWRQCFRVCAGRRHCYRSMTERRTPKACYLISVLYLFLTSVRFL